MEVKKVFKGIGEPFKVSVSSQRVHTQKNHFLDLRIKCHRRPKDKHEILEVLRNFNPLAALNAAGCLTHSPLSPLIVTEEMGTPRPIMPDGKSELGMKVMVGQVDSDDIYDVRMAVMVDNIDRGAFGGLLQSAEYVVNGFRDAASAKMATEQQQEISEAARKREKELAAYTAAYFTCADASST